MQLFYAVCAFWLLSSSTSALECEKVEDDVKTHKILTEAEEFCVEVKNGFNIYFEVDSVETSVDSLDYLIIKEGKSLEDDGHGLIFAHKLKREQSFLIFSSTAFVKFNIADDTGFSSRASINYKRVGKEIATTTERPSTENPWPQPSPNDSIYYTAHISGHQYPEYTNEAVRLSFRESVAKMAQEYVQINNFPITETITYNNVLLHDLNMCDLKLPDSSSCAEITFALPIILNESLYAGYELKESHISLMWTRYSDRYLEENGFSNYKVPDLKAATVAWSTVVAVVIILLMVCILIGVILYPRIAQAIMLERRGDNSSQIYLTFGKKRSSDTSLEPHTYQVPDMLQGYEDEPGSKANEVVKYHTSEEPGSSTWVASERHYK